MAYSQKFTNAYTRELYFCYQRTCIIQFQYVLIRNNIYLVNSNNEACSLL